jgi:hypothetical protein
MGMGGAHSLSECSGDDIKENRSPVVHLVAGYYTVAYLPKSRTVTPQKPRNTHATNEVRVCIARCWVTHATVERVLI